MIIALLVVALIVAIAARFTSDFQVTVARSQQKLAGAQLQQLLFGAENFARWGLVDDAKSDGTNFGSYDHAKEPWAEEVLRETEVASVAGTLEDALSRFNLNQLQGKAPAPTAANPAGSFGARFTVGQQRFIRLLQADPDNPVDLSLAEEITEAVIDWIDSDDNVTGAGGAETAYYQSQPKPYRPANQLFVSATELQLIKGMTPEIYAYLEPLIIALPSDVGININTAPPQLIRALNGPNITAPLELSEATTLLSAIPEPNSSGDTGETEALSSQASPRSEVQESPYEKVADFLSGSDAQTVFGADASGKPSPDGLHTGSEYFVLTTEVELLDYKRKQISLLKRVNTPTGVKTIVLRRSQAQL